ncbi:hypothetical protein AALP_AAs58154U000100 [Arabis alpina]|uniref:Zinc knuckle CX2CX4HX4C domain-containing protein n=1 Tax=Arabis alpina TaxID=50452 RepID=A0A087G0W0_ARAAL|nr:hypothetical protein AALP_AAs58154U000100 [Arabis alpina]
MRRESDDAGQICVLHLQYEKLHKYCNRCFRLTHEAPACPERARDQFHHREQRREQYEKREEEEKRGKQRSTREDRGKAVTFRRTTQEQKRRGPESMASSSRPKPVRRELLSELDASGVNSTLEKPSTKKWVSKAFSATFGKPVKTGRAVDQQSPMPDSRRTKPKAPWYRDTEEEAAMANEVAFQQAKWAAAFQSQASEEQKVGPVGISDGSGM